MRGGRRCGLLRKGRRILIKYFKKGPVKGISGGCQSKVSDLGARRADNGWWGNGGSDAWRSIVSADGTGRRDQGLGRERRNKESGRSVCGRGSLVDELMEGGKPQVDRYTGVVEPDGIAMW